MKKALPLLCLLCFLFAACRPATEEAKIHALFAKGSAAVEDSNVRGVTDLLADDFKADGDLDKQTIKAFLAQRMLHGDKITVVRRGETIEVDGDKATAAFDAALLAGPRQHGGVLPQRMGTYHFDITLTKKDGEWKVNTARHQDLPAAKFAVEAADL